MNPGPSAYKADALPLSYSGARRAGVVNGEKKSIRCRPSVSADWGEGVPRATEALLAQWLERAAVNRKVTGSIPVGSVSSCHGDRRPWRRLRIRKREAPSGWHCVRVVKESDLNSDGLCPHRFEPCRCRFSQSCLTAFTCEGDTFRGGRTDEEQLDSMAERSKAPA